MRDVYQRARPLLLSMRVWRTRILLWAAAGAVGAAAVAFAQLADAAQSVFARIASSQLPWPWIVTPLGLCGISWLTRRYFNGAEGSGIPQTIYALGRDSGALGIAFLRMHVVLGRVFLAAAALLCGASIGREGPTVHVGAAITQAFARWMPHGEPRARRHALILAGGAAGVAAAFNTPLAGVVFAIEELSRSFEERASGTTLTAVILAGVAAIALSGNYTYFGEPHLYANAQALTFRVIAVALVAGLAGGLFSRVTLSASRGLPGALGRFQTKHPGWFALTCGLAIVALGTATGGLTYGTGYAEARQVLENSAQLPWSYAPARALATLLSFLSGVPAGLLAPSLSVGAGLGQMLGDLFGQASGAEFAILGMCGYLAGVTQAPLTSFVIVMEMTTGHEIVLPLMLTATIGTVVSRLLSPPLYRTLAERYVTGPTSSPGAGMKGPGSRATDSPPHPESAPASVLADGPRAQDPCRADDSPPSR
jgi:chloride channel protein, CIC family